MSAPETSAAAAPETTLRIEGPLVIATVAGWHAKLVEALTGAGGLSIDLSGITEVDVFGLQLLCSARRSAGKDGARPRLKAGPALIDKACARAGIGRSELFDS